MRYTYNVMIDIIDQTYELPVHQETFGPWNKINMNSSTIDLRAMYLCPYYYIAAPGNFGVAIIILLLYLPYLCIVISSAFCKSFSTKYSLPTCMYVRICNS